MASITTESQAKIVLIWPGPITGPEGTLGFFVEYETDEGDGCVLVTSSELEEHGLIRAFEAEQPVSLLTIRSRTTPRGAFTSPSPLPVVVTSD